MKLQIGHVVKLKTQCLNNVVGTLGVVVDAYNFPASNGLHYGYTIIFENGAYDGFAEEDEVDTFLEILSVCEPLSSYKFRNVDQLWKDYKRGYFDVVLKPMFPLNVN